MNRFLSLLLSATAIVAGLLFIAGGVVQLVNKETYDLTVPATVVEINEEIDSETNSVVNVAYVDFEVNGVKHEHVRAYEQYGNLSVGDTVEISYRSGVSAEAAEHSATFVTLLVMGLGAVTVVLSSITAHKVLKALKSK